MTINEQETAILIKHYEVLKQEMSYEGERQLASIVIVQKRYNQQTIDKLKRLIELEKLVTDQQKEIRRLEAEQNGKASRAIVKKPDPHVYESSY